MLHVVISYSRIVYVFSRPIVSETSGRNVLCRVCVSCNTLSDQIQFAFPIQTLTGKPETHQVSTFHVVAEALYAPASSPSSTSSTLSKIGPFTMTDHSDNTVSNENDKHSYRIPTTPSGKRLSWAASAASS